MTSDHPLTPPSPLHDPDASTSGSSARPSIAAARGHAGPPAWRGWAIFGITAVAFLGVGLMYGSIMQRRGEAAPPPPLQTIGALESDSAAWAVNWPREYGSYLQTQDATTRTKYGGGFPRNYLEESPANVILFAGYGFAKEYLQGRGHAYAVEDVSATDRITPKAVATCWSCKSPDVPRLMAEFGKDECPEGAPLQDLVLAGADEFYGHNFHDLKNEVTHAIGCLDCHDPDTMQLRISRPALIEAFQRQGRDINQVSHQEMRSLVCAQCHVEYYFKGGNYLTFPWDKGMTIESMNEYYDEYNFSDWTHAISKTPMIKMQHPDYEVYATGIHAFRGVSCADCHMPYRTEGGQKYTSHHVQSPLLDVSTSCQVCHRWSEHEIVGRVNSMQDKVRRGRDLAEDAIAKAHFDIAACVQAGAGESELTAARELVRKAQVRWDYVAANNGMGFHSPQECTRILGEATNFAQQARIETTRILAARGYTDLVHYPDFASEAKAKAVIKAFIDGTPPDLLNGWTPGTGVQAASPDDEATRPQAAS